MDLFKFYIRSKSNTLSVCLTFLVYPVICKTLFVRGVKISHCTISRCKVVPFTNFPFCSLFCCFFSSPDLKAPNFFLSLFCPAFCLSLYWFFFSFLKSSLEPQDQNQPNLIVSIIR